MDEAKPVILEKYPLLADVIAPADINETNVDVWLKKQATLYGKFLLLPRSQLISMSASIRNLKRPRNCIPPRLQRF